MSFLLSSLSNCSPQNCQPKLSTATSPPSVTHQLHSTQLAFLFTMQSCLHLPSLVISSFLFPKWVSFPWRYLQVLTMAPPSFSILTIPASTTGTYISISFLPTDSCFTSLYNSVN